MIRAGKLTADAAVRTGAAAAAAAGETGGVDEPRGAGAVWPCDAMPGGFSCLKTNPIPPHATIPASSSIVRRMEDRERGDSFMAVNPWDGIAGEKYRG